MEPAEHARTSDIDIGRIGQVANDTAEMGFLSSAREHGVEYMIDIEIEERGLEAKGEHAGEGFVVRMPGDI